MKKQKVVESPSKQNFDALQAEFEAIKAKKVPTVKTKIINLNLITGCGCGDSYDEVHIIVPEDYNEFSELETIDDDDYTSIVNDGFEVYNNHFYGTPEEDINKEIW